MATLHRNYSQYSECIASSLEKQIEWGFDFMRSHKAKLKRDNVDLTRICKK